MNFSYHIGKRVEEEAALWFLSQRKSRLIARNFRTRPGEIDLIFEETLLPSEKQELVFVEVRFRSKDRSWLDSAESITWRKQVRLFKTIQIFLMKYKGPAQTLRFDVLGWDGSKWEHRTDIQLLESKLSRA